MRFLLALSCVCWSLNCSGYIYYVEVPTNSASGCQWRYVDDGYTSPWSSIGGNSSGHCGQGASKSSSVTTTTGAANFTFHLTWDGGVTITYLGSYCYTVGSSAYWSGSGSSPVVTNLVHSMCLTNRSPLVMQVLASVVDSASGDSWGVTPPGQVIAVGPGQIWCGSWTLPADLPNARICAYLVEPGDDGGLIVSDWSQSCSAVGGVASTSSPVSTNASMGVVSSQSVSNTLVAVFGTNIASSLSSTGALTSSSLGALLAAQTSAAAQQSAGLVSSAGGLTNLASGASTNSVPYNGSNVVSAVGRVEQALTNRYEQWEGTNGWAEGAQAQYALGANSLGGYWNVGSNSFRATATTHLYDVGTAMQADVEASEMDARLSALGLSSGQGAVLDKIKPQFNPWNYPGFRRICTLLKRFLIWFGALYCLKIVWQRIDKLVRTAMILPDLSGSSNVIVAFWGLGGSTTLPAGLIRAAIFTGGFGVLVPALMAFAGDVTAWMENPFVADGSTLTVLGPEGSGMAAESVWYVVWVWVNRVCPLGVWLCQAYYMAIWWWGSVAMFTFFAGGNRWVRI